MKIYTINNKHSDSNGAFDITPEELSSISVVHQHSVDDVQDILASISLNNHTHTNVNTLNIFNGNDKISLDNDIALNTEGYLQISNVGNTVTITNTKSASNIISNVVNQKDNLNYMLCLYNTIASASANQVNNKQLIFI